MKQTAAKALLHAACLVFALGAGAVYAQKTLSPLPNNYPNKPIRMLVGNAPGGGTDILARGVGQKLTELWSVPVLVENRSGGSGVIVLELLAQAPPDGYTMLVGGSQIELSAVFKRVNFDILKNFAPIVEMTTQPYLLVIGSSVPAKSVKELIALAKSKPGQLNYASAGLGSAGHLGHELFNSLIGAKTEHIPYRGAGAAVPDLVGGRVQFMFISTISGTPLVRNGTLRALAITSLKRLDSMPDLPTVSESGVPGFELNNGYGLYTSARTPPAIIVAVNREVTRIVNLPDMKEKLAADGAEPAPPLSPAEYRVKVAKKIAQWSEVAKAAGIQSGF